MNVIIGYDGSPCADDAITDLQRAGLPDDGEALVLTAADVFLPPQPDEDEPPPPPLATVAVAEVECVRARAEHAMTHARGLADHAAVRVRELFPRWSVRAEARANAPHWGLVEAAAERHADLIVVGSHGRSAVGRTFLGSVSQMVLQYAPCSVRVGRCPPPPARPREPRVRLVLGVDGSVDSAAAVSAVASRIWPAGTEVLVVGVIDSRVALSYLEPAYAPCPDPGGAAAAPLPDLGSPLEAVCDELRHAGIAATPRLQTGDPKRVLLREAEQWDADCIVVGARGHSRVQRLLLGSVSASVAARAHCAVEVVRTGT